MFSVKGLGITLYAHLKNHSLVIMDTSRYEHDLTTTAVMKKTDIVYNDAQRDLAILY